MEQPKYRERDWLYEEYYKKGRSLTDIAEELDVDHTTISKWRRKLDIPKPSSKITLECPVCGDTFSRPKSKVERAKHASVCSRECHYKGRSEGVISREIEDGYDTSPTIYDRECPNCGENFVTTATEDYEHCSRECFLAVHSDRMAGENNPAYKNGSSSDKRCYRGPHWSRIRKRVYERDEYNCQRCGVKCVSRDDYDGTNGDRIIQAHHIGGYESRDDNKLRGLVTLCASCHGKVEGGAPLGVDTSEIN